MKQAFLDARFREMVRGYPKEIRLQIGLAINAAQEAFGQPHRHAGLGLRKLSRRLYEIRVGLDLRLLFINEPDGIFFVFVGKHDEVKQFLKHSL